MRLILPRKISFQRGIEEDWGAVTTYVAHDHLVARAPRGGGGGRGGIGGSSGGSSGGKGVRAVSFGGGSRGASTYSKGGGPPATISSGSFIGRTAGGGAREQIYGTTRYGSGYTSGGGSFVSGRNFPFGYWPIYLPIVPEDRYHGYREYGPATNSSRPGGTMHQAQVRSSLWPAVSANSSTTINNATASYYIVGDSDSVAAVMDELVVTCSVTSASSVRIDEANSAVRVEQAVQYYRATSFMLALESYNNTANLPSNAPIDNNTATLPLSADTSLPEGTDMSFLKCVNDTIGASVPIMNAPKNMKKTIIAATLTTVGVVLLLAVCIYRIIRDNRWRYTRLSRILRY